MLLKWPDWQLPALFTSGFKVAGLAEASNIFPLVTPVAEESLNSLLNEEEADALDKATAHISLPCDLDKDVYDTALDQVKRGLLFKPMLKT